MGDTTKIEWCDATWNPVTGCQKVSAGCKHCYAEGVADRWFATQYPPVLCTRCKGRGGVPDIDNAEHRTTVLARCPDCEGSGELTRRFTDVMCHPDRLDQPLRWRKPRRVFVNSMSDLFHEDVPDDFIRHVFYTMQQCASPRSPGHQFLILTKRPERMREIMQGEYARVREYADKFDLCPTEAMRTSPAAKHARKWAENPCPNVWLGVSVEDQARADQRIPILLDTPAAVRFVSYEPALEPVTFEDRWLAGPIRRMTGMGWDPRIDWIIVGGESGHLARRFDLQWARDTIAACRAAGVAVFVKQLGARPIERLTTGGRFNGKTVIYELTSRKGGDPDEWPEDLRIREFPTPPNRTEGTF